MTESNAIVARAANNKNGYTFVDISKLRGREVKQLRDRLLRAGHRLDQPVTTALKGTKLKVSV